MPAVSQKQQRFMGMVYNAKKTGKEYGESVARAVASLTKEQAKHFAATRHKGLPKTKQHGKDE